MFPFSASSSNATSLFPVAARQQFIDLCRRDDVDVIADQWTSMLTMRQFLPSRQRRTSVTDWAKRQGRVICYACLCTVPPEEKSMPFACNCRERQRQRANRLKCSSYALPSKDRLVVVGKARDGAPSKSRTGNSPHRSTSKLSHIKPKITDTNQSGQNQQNIVYTISQSPSPELAEKSNGDMHDNESMQSDNRSSISEEHINDQTSETLTVDTGPCCYEIARCVNKNIERPVADGDLKLTSPTNIVYTQIQDAQPTSRAEQNNEAVPPTTISFGTDSQTISPSSLMTPLKMVTETEKEKEKLSLSELIRAKLSAVKRGFSSPPTSIYFTTAINGSISAAKKSTLSTKNEEKSGDKRPIITSKATTKPNSNNKSAKTAESVEKSVCFKSANIKEPYFPAENKSNGSTKPQSAEIDSRELAINPVAAPLNPAACKDSDKINEGTIVAESNAKRIDDECNGPNDRFDISTDLAENNQNYNINAPVATPKADFEAIIAETPRPEQEHKDSFSRNVKFNGQSGSQVTETVRTMEASIAEVKFDSSKDSSEQIQCVDVTAHSSEPQTESKLERQIGLISFEHPSTSPVSSFAMNVPTSHSASSSGNNSSPVIDTPDTVVQSIERELYMQQSFSSSPSPALSHCSSSTKRRKSAGAPPWSQKRRKSSADSSTVTESDEKSQRRHKRPKREYTPTESETGNSTPVADNNKAKYNTNNLLEVETKIKSHFNCYRAKSLINERAFGKPPRLEIPNLDDINTPHYVIRQNNSPLQMTIVKITGPSQNRSAQNQNILPHIPNLSSKIDSIKKPSLQASDTKPLIEAKTVNKESQKDVVHPTTRTDCSANQLPQSKLVKALNLEKKISQLKQNYVETVGPHTIAKSSGLKTTPKVSSSAIKAKISGGKAKKSTPKSDSQPVKKKSMESSTKKRVSEPSSSQAESLKENDEFKMTLHPVYGIRIGDIVWARAKQAPYWPGRVIELDMQSTKVAWCGESTYNEVDINTVEDFMKSLSNRFPPASREMSGKKKLCLAIADAIDLVKPAKEELDFRLNTIVAKALMDKYEWDLDGITVFSGKRRVRISNGSLSQTKTTSVPASSLIVVKEEPPDDTMTST
ncbi:PWWP domain-containing protein [Ditylenchus destructor]|nr:PWWP domain-containing protein [Ditylenchus destructor]